MSRAVDGMDIPEWISIGLDGQTHTRDGSIRDLEAMLAVPPGKRDSPHLDFIWWNEAPAKVTVLYWVYGQHDGLVVGTMIRDTWIATPVGWRRSVHEKLFPNRTLIDHGKPVILPPLADHLR